MINRTFGWDQIGFTSEEERRWGSSFSLAVSNNYAEQDCHDTTGERALVASYVLLPKNKVSIEKYIYIYFYGVSNMGVVYIYIARLVNVSSRILLLHESSRGHMHELTGPPEMLHGFFSPGRPC